MSGIFTVILIKQKKEVCGKKQTVTLLYQTKEASTSLRRSQRYGLLLCIKRAFSSIRIGVFALF